jgi:hypothetical protein
MSSSEDQGIPPPSALALVLCDAIWTDPGTGKKFLLGCFGAISAREFPAAHPILSAYILLTNGRGSKPFRVLIVDVDEDREPISEINGDVNFPDIRTVVAIDAVFLGLSFPAAGEYRMQVFVGGEFIIERSILVLQI